MARNRPSRAQVVQTSSVPAPIGGLNARDSIAAMPPTDAVTMVNWFPTPTTIDVRNGSQDFSTGITGWVETLMVYNGLTGSKMFAVAGTTYYDVSNPGTATVLPVGFINNARWSYTNFATPGGSFLVAVNGVDRLSLYDGTNWSPVNVGTGVAISSITHTGTLATVTTSAAHNLFTGTRIMMIGNIPSDYNGTYYITVLNGTMFTYTMATTPPTNAGVGQTISTNTNGTPGSSIGSITFVGTTATLTCAPAHGLLTGATVTVSGSSPAAYNGTFIITVTGATTFTYTMLSTPASNATGGSYVSRTTTAVVTTSGVHGLSNGTSVTVTGATPAAYNGTFSVTVINTTKFSYVMASIPSADASPTGAYTTPLGTYSLFISITGVDTAILNYVTAFKGRLYFIEKNSLRIWYLPPASVGGAAILFDMSSVFKLGGHMVAMQSWNIDTVAGPSDYFAFFSSTGEVVVYTGFDPSQSSTWNLQGNFRIGRPASGSRFVTKVGSDLYAITVDGLVPLSKAMLTDRSQSALSVSNKIDNLINNDVVTYASNFGWQVFLSPQGNKIMVNVPMIEDQSQYQYVCNTITGSWTVFNGWNAAVFELYGDRTMYGTLGKVVWCDTGSTDNGTAIITDLKPAFSSFGAPGQNKQFTMARPIFSDGGSVGISAILNVDFRDAPPTATLSLPPQANVSFWDVSPWNTSFWALAGQVNINWQSVAGIGYQASYRMKTISKVDCSLLAIDYGYQVGGIY